MARRARGRGSVVEDGRVVEREEHGGQIEGDLARLLQHRLADMSWLRDRHLDVHEAHGIFAAVRRQFGAQGGHAEAKHEVQRDVDSDADADKLPDGRPTRTTMRTEAGHGQRPRPYHTSCF